MPRNLVRDRKIREERRKKILESALQQFAKKGPAFSKIQDIAKEAGMSHALVYNYFKSKEEIFAVLAQESLEGMNKRLHDMKNLPLSPTKRLEWLLDELSHLDNNKIILHLVFMDQVYISQIFSSKDFHANIRDYIQKIMEENYRIITEVFQEGQESGEFIGGEATQHALVFHSLIRGFIYARYSGIAHSEMSKELLVYFKKDNQ